jgi:hypothetical protein
LAAPEPQFGRSSAAVCPRSPSLNWVYKEPSVDPFFFFSSSHDNLPNLHNAFHKQQPLPQSQMPPNSLRNKRIAKAMKESAKKKKVSDDLVLTSSSETADNEPATSAQGDNDEVIGDLQMGEEATPTPSPSGTSSDLRSEDCRVFQGLHRSFDAAVLEPGWPIRADRSVTARLGRKPLAAAGPASADRDVTETTFRFGVPTASAFNFSMKRDVNGKSVHVANRSAEANAAVAVESSVLEAGPASADHDRNRPLFSALDGRITEQVDHHCMVMCQGPDSETK